MDKRVMVIHSNHDYDANEHSFPPIGAIGTTISEIDEYEEYDVLFDNYPCPNSLPDISWVTHRSMIVFIDDDNFIEDINEDEKIIDYIN